MAHGQRLVLQIRAVSDDNGDEEAVHVDVNDGAGPAGDIGRDDIPNADWVRGVEGTSWQRLRMS